MKIISVVAWFDKRDRLLGFLVADQQASLRSTTEPPTTHQTRYADFLSLKMALDWLLAWEQA